jgi:hypothetical protein
VQNYNNDEHRKANITDSMDHLKAFNVDLQKLSVKLDGVWEDLEEDSADYEAYE